MVSRAAVQSVFHVAGCVAGNETEKLVASGPAWGPTWMLWYPPGESGLGPQELPARSEASTRICAS